MDGFSSKMDGFERLEAPDFLVVFAVCSTVVHRVNTLVENNSKLKQRESHIVCIHKCVYTL